MANNAKGFDLHIPSKQKSPPEGRLILNNKTIRTKKQINLLAQLDAFDVLKQHLQRYLL
jgi:hypothetical protein